MKSGFVCQGDFENMIPYLIESDISSKECRSSWARLIEKIYEIDPLICPKCRGTMRIISSIEDQDVVKALLQYLGMWTIRPRPPAKAHAPSGSRYATDDICHSFLDNTVYGDPDYP
jgi:hypothetical protein